MSAILVLFGPAAGPFAEPLAYMDYSLVRMCGVGAILLMFIAMHPYRPNWATALMSAVSLAIWFLLGFSYTYAGV